MRLIKVTDIQGCFSEQPFSKVVDLNPDSIAWINPLGRMFDVGPYFCVHFIGNSCITVDAVDYGAIMKATEQ